MKIDKIISKETKKIRIMTITSCLLSISILLSFLTNYIKISFLGSFLTLDLSLVFIIPLIFICGFFSSLFSSIVIGVISFFWSESGWIGMVVNIFVNMSVIMIIYIFSFFIFKKNKKYLWIKLLIMFIISLLILCVFLSFFNAILFQPLYWWIFGYLKTPSLIEAIEKYNSNPNIFLLFIDEYWKGTFTLYTIFNSIKFSVVFLLTIYPLYIIIKHNLSQKYFYSINV